MKDRKYRLMGFGHRVYKNYDPRAKVMQKTCHEVLDEVGDGDDPLLKVAMELEKIALNDPYFVERKLYPNVDFYSGITLKALGFPPEMFTVLFALARTVGWITQWKEMFEDPQRKIGRPRQLYTGPTSRDFVAIDKRALAAQRAPLAQHLDHRLGGRSAGSGPPRPILSRAAFCAAIWARATPDRPAARPPPRRAPGRCSPPGAARARPPRRRRC